MTTKNQAVDDSGDEINLLEILDTILAAKWLIAAVTAVFVVLAILYAVLSTPIYQSNVLIQVEQNNNVASSMLGAELGALVGDGSSAAAEMEILRSRLVVGNAVEDLKLYIQAEPKYLPLIGRWLARRADSVSTPGFFGMGGYVSGNESITVAQLNVPALLEGKTLTLRVTDTGYDLFDPDGKLLCQGVVGKACEFEALGYPGNIVVEALHGLANAEFLLKRDSALRKTEDLQSNLQVSERGRQSGIINVSLEGDDTKRLADTLQTIGTIYVQQNTERKAAEAEKTLGFLDGFLPEIQKQMQVSETDYTKFRDQHGTFDLGAEGKAQLEASVALQVKLLELQQQRRTLTPQYTAAHPAIKTIDQQINALQAEIKRMERDMRRMPELQQELLNLSRNVQVNSELYVNLLNSAQQLRLVKEGKVGSVRIIDNAVIPEQAIKPKKAFIALVAMILGLIVGIGITLTRKMLHAGIAEAHEIEDHLGLSVFASVPRSGEQLALFKDIHDKKPGKHVLAELFPKDPAIESLRSLRTAMQFAMLAAKNNIILISGATPQIGKSFVSVNFAQVIASGDKRVLLIDADLRKGYMNQYFGLDRKQGLSEVISGSLDLSQAIHRNILPNLDFIATGALPPNPAELLLNPVTKNLLQDLSQQYDYIVVDSAPVLAVSDTLALLNTAGTCFLVARAEVTRLAELEETVKRIRHAGAEVNGIILNDIPLKNRRYSYKYGNYRYQHYDYSS
ncbi:polysaccharide biosynthesis tyrosine autokinase [Alcaligenes endophyticus]|uniref:Polysaccharide biosynthesis tyrosine autokinase n=1 Tax=Alcaligenes endophyticus TaxID=1929088 RepID=A0ABT8EFS6_9BURK|nr:polysaccharide biosynthesis tyrosine autokinase [Alcaligenes endophyticus]MCX5590202.1 polysaccharide biosynthesis tyrosine autokinase [Alcaligenes endophyticus]MDN4120135.1 polysaccharide biosynthesis tyrosine autokinase [Alcaligenes endophyticus]